MITRLRRSEFSWVERVENHREPSELFLTLAVIVGVMLFGLLVAVLETAAERHLGVALSGAESFGSPDPVTRVQ